jgi:hypothetical protein
MALRKNKKPDISKQSQYFNDLAKSTEDQNQLIMKWIADNEQLWLTMSESQRAELLSVGEHGKSADQLVKKWNQIANLGSDFHSSTQALVKELGAGVKHGSAMHGLSVGLSDRTKEYTDLLKLGTKLGKKKAAIIQTTVDRTAEVYGNMQSIGTEEFISLNLSRDIAKAKAYGMEQDVKNLTALQAQQDAMKKVHTQIDETAKLIEQPFTALDDWIKQIPVFGGLLSSLMPFDDWGKQLSDEFRESASEQALEQFSGITPDQRKEQLEAQQKIDDDFVKNHNQTMKKYAEDNRLIFNEVTEKYEKMNDEEKALQDNKVETSKITSPKGVGDTYGGVEDISITGNATIKLLGKSTFDFGGQSLMNEDEWLKSTGNEPQRHHPQTKQGYEDYLQKSASPAEQMLPVDIFGLIASNTDRTAIALEGAKASPEFGVMVENWEELITKIKGLIPVLASAMKKAFGGGDGDGDGGNGAGAEDKSKDAEPNVAGEDDDEPDDGIKKQLSIKEKVMEKMKKTGKKMSEVWSKMPVYGKALVATIGLAFVGLYKMYNTAREMGMEMGKMPAAAFLFKEEAQGILDEFGSLEGVTSGNLLNMKMMAFWNGVSADDMAKIAALQMASSDVNLAGALKEQSKWMKEIKKEGLSASKVMADMAANADFMAENLRGGGENIRNAAKHMAKMGLSLTEADQVTESLLDWETRINNEMEASVVLGRSINLDRAARLAYDGKIEEAMKEAKRQAGGEAAFIKMSSTERKVLGNAIGLQGEALAKFMQTEEQQRLSAKKQEEEGARARMLQWAMWGALAMGLVVGVVSALTLGAATAGALAWGAGGFAAGAVLGGVLAGGIGYATAATGMDQMVAKPTMIMAGEAGREHVGITPMKGGGPPEVAPPVNVDTSKIESQNDKIITLLSKMPTSVLTEDLAKGQKRATLDSGRQI